MVKERERPSPLTILQSFPSHDRVISPPPSQRKLIAIFILQANAAPRILYYKKITREHDGFSFFKNQTNNSLLLFFPHSPPQSPYCRAV